MSTPIVIQGTAVSNPHQKSSTPAQVYESGPSGGNALQQSNKQETSCNDPIFAFLFYGCVAAMVSIAAIKGPDAFGSVDSGSTTTYDYSGYFIAASIIVVLSFGAAAVGMAVMMCIPEFLIKTSLIFVVVLSGLWAVMAFMAGNLFGGILGVIFFLIGICYARAVWSRIPFATINLVTGCTAIRKHCTITIFSYFFAILAGGWSLIWAIAFFGVYNSVFECDDEAAQTGCQPNYGVLFGLFLAFFFGQQVFQNSIHVCIAGTVGGWWFEPDDSRVGCCDMNVFNSFLRTMTTSFGSICFGSLLVAILEALRALARSARENGDAQFLACIAECILACLASIVEYFNKWAFIYVGLYGMPYLKAGKSVMELFQNRGWEAVIADDLVGNTLFLVSVVVGGIMGGISVLLHVSSDLLEDAGGVNITILVFFVGFLIGLFITSILMNTIGSAVNAVVVLFADAPNEFQQNHPELSQRMREIWNDVYPGSV